MADIDQSIQIRSRLGKSTVEKLDKMLKECAENKGGSNKKNRASIGLKSYTTEQVG
jgi:hypothetical protein